MFNDCSIKLFVINDSSSSQNQNIVPKRIKDEGIISSLYPVQSAICIGDAAWLKIIFADR
jgi:hypothetical protein